MSLEALIITASMFALASIPVFVHPVRKYYGPIFLFGTGALLGICAFDLIPDFFKSDGLSGLSLVAVVWVAYSFIHLFHDHHHIEELCNDESSACEHKRSPYIFLIAISAHCYTSGLLLGISNHFSKQLAHAVFLALIGHKIYEALTVSTLLTGFKRTRTWTLSLLLFYLLSFPAGVITTDILKGEISHNAVFIISGLAIGSLGGCLVFDFLVPSYHYVRRRSLRIAWLLAGVVLTVLFI